MTDHQYTELDPSSLFDAVCYLGKGRWQRLQDLLSQGSDTSWFGNSFTKALVDLGHIDIALDTSGRRPEFWSCSPPALVVTDKGDAYLSGFRCQTLVHAARAALDGIGTFQNVTQETGPPALVWAGIETAAASSQMALVSDPHRRAVRVVRSPAMEIALHAPRLSTVAEALPEIHVERVSDLERFDPATAQWRTAASLEQAGAYRTSFAGRRHIYRSPSGSLSEGSYEVVKLLAARDSGHRLHGYEASKETFECFLGCEPPGLFRRSLVSCTGKLPTRSNGKLSYTGVREELAAVILGKLYN